MVFSFLMDNLASSRFKKVLHVASETITAATVIKSCNGIQEDEPLALVEGSMAQKCIYPTNEPRASLRQPSCAISPQQTQDPCVSVEEPIKEKSPTSPSKSFAQLKSQKTEMEENKETLTSANCNVEVVKSSTALRSADKNCSTLESTEVISESTNQNIDPISEKISVHSKGEKIIMPEVTYKSKLQKQSVVSEPKNQIYLESEKKMLKWKDLSFLSESVEPPSDISEISLPENVESKSKECVLESQPKSCPKYSSKKPSSRLDKSLPQANPTFEPIGSSDKVPSQNPASPPLSRSEAEHKHPLSERKCQDPNLEDEVSVMMKDSTSEKPCCSKASEFDELQTCEKEGPASDQACVTPKQTDSTSAEAMITSCKSRNTSKMCKVENPVKITSSQPLELITPLSNRLICPPQYSFSSRISTFVTNTINHRDGIQLAISNDASAKNINAPHRLTLTTPNGRPATFGTSSPETPVSEKPRSSSKRSTLCSQQSTPKPTKIESGKVLSTHPRIIPQTCALKNLEQPILKSQSPRSAIPSLCTTVGETNTAESLRKEESFNSPKSFRRPKSSFRVVTSHKSKLSTYIGRTVPSKSPKSKHSLCIEAETVPNTVTSERIRCTNTPISVNSSSTTSCDIDTNGEQQISHMKDTTPEEPGHCDDVNVVSSQNIKNCGVEITAEAPLPGDPPCNLAACSSPTIISSSLLQSCSTDCSDGKTTNQSQLPTKTPKSLSEPLEASLSREPPRDKPQSLTKMISPTVHSRKARHSDISSLQVVKNIPPNIFINHVNKLKFVTKIENLLFNGQRLELSKQKKRTHHHRVTSAPSMAPNSQKKKIELSGKSIVPSDRKHCHHECRRSRQKREVIASGSK